MGVAVTRRRFLQAAAGAGVVVASGAWRDAVLARSRGVWLAGDFHCHTVFSHDVYGGPTDDNTGPDEFYTLGHTPGEQIATAELRGLDFLAITDHNDVRSALQADYASNRLILLPGYEHSLWGGHAGVFVPAVANLGVIDDPTYGTNFEGDAAFGRFLDLVAERDGMVILNHPFYKGMRTGDLGGRTWKYSEAASQGVAAVEAWNAAWLMRYETSPLYDANDDLAVQWWEAHFAQRHAMVGGSDNHWKSLAAVGGVGQPTTWVYAANRSVTAVLDAVRAGRTFISAQPPLLGGTRLFLSATETWGDHHTAMVGGTVAALGKVRARVRVVNGVGAVLRLVSTGMVVHEQRIVLPNQVVEHTVVLPEGGTLRAEAYDHAGLLMRALTSAIGTSGTAPSPRPVTTGPPVSYEVLGAPAVPSAAAGSMPACECAH